MLPILHIGPLAIQFSGLIILAGLWLGLTLAERHSHSHQIQANQLYNLAVGSLISAVLGARLSYALRYMEAFIANPVSLISLNPGLLDPWGAFAGGLLFLLVFGQRKKMPFWNTADALTPTLAVFAVAYHLSNLASGASFGSPTTLPWGIGLWGTNRHPVQAYEALAACGIAFLLWPGRTRLSVKLPGDYFLSWVALSAASKLYFEAYHGDSTLLAGGVRMAQVAAWVILAVSLYALHKNRPARDQEGLNEIVSNHGSSL